MHTALQLIQIKYSICTIKPKYLATIQMSDVYQLKDA